MALESPLLPKGDGGRLNRSQVSSVVKPTKPNIYGVLVFTIKLSKASKEDWKLVNMNSAHGVFRSRVTAYSRSLLRSGLKATALRVLN